MSPNLPRAVITSEDGALLPASWRRLGGVKEAIESAGDGIARGGSTISMQVVKNLFLWPSKSYVRKALEIPLAYAIEVVWPKRRILEIYLNIAEWGPGVFGAEAAARYHFRKAAASADPARGRLAGGLAAQPLRAHGRRLRDPGTQRLADNLLLRMRAARATRPACQADGASRPASPQCRMASLWPCARNAAISPAACGLRGAG